MSRKRPNVEVTKYPFWVCPDCGPLDRCSNISGPQFPVVSFDNVVDGWSVTPSRKGEARRSRLAERTESTKRREGSLVN